MKRECNGLCLAGWEVGVPEYRGIAYPHPECWLHGYDFAPSSTEDNRLAHELELGRLIDLYTKGYL